MIFFARALRAYCDLSGEDIFYCTDKAKFDGISVSFVQNDVLTCGVCSSEVLLRTNCHERRDTICTIYMLNLFNSKQ